MIYVSIATTSWYRKFQVFCLQIDVRMDLSYMSRFRITNEDTIIGANSLVAQQEENAYRTATDTSAH